MADQPETITRLLLAQLLDDEADLATRTVVSSWLGTLRMTSVQSGDVRVVHD
jgi:hypothetical protein